MEQYVSKSALVTEIKRILSAFENSDAPVDRLRASTLIRLLSFIDTLEVKEVNEVPATVMVNKYGNRFISSWPGLKEYDDFKKGEEIKIVIPKKVNL